MKIFYAIVNIALVFAMLAGCSTMRAPSKGATFEAKTTQSTAANIDLPNVQLTDEIFFKVVSAEIAFQRGDFPTAFATTLAVAEQTHDPRLAKRAMEMALLSKQPLQAFVAAKLWHEYAPHSDEATQYYLGFMIANNNWDEVKSILVPRLAAVTPKERGTMLMQIQRMVARSSDKKAAFALVEDLCRPYRGELEAHLALALAAFTNHDGARALNEARTATQLDPRSSLAALTLAQISSSPNDALQSLADFLKRNPADNDVRRAYAGMLVEQKKYVEARQQFDVLAKAKPDDPNTLYALGILSLQLEDDVAAEKNLTEFARLIEDTPNEQRDPTSAYLYLSQIADDRNDGVAALNWLAKIQSYNGKNAAYFNAQLRRALLISKYESLETARDFLHNLKADPSEQIDIIELDAELLRNANRDAEAIQLLQEATIKYPNNPDLLYDFAMMAEKLDRFDEMEFALRRVIAINPENQQAYNALGYSFAERNIHLAEARKLLEKALSIAPNDAFIIDSMGWLEFKENKNETALAFLQRAYQIRPDADIAVHLGEVLWVMGERQKAREIWKEAQKKDPNNAALKSTLARLRVNL